VRDLLDGEISDVVQDQHLALPQRDARERLAERGEGQRVPGFGHLRPAARPQQRHGPQGPADPPGGVDGEPHRDLPHPGLGQFVAADPGPARQRPGERLLRDVVGFVPVSGDGGDQGGDLPVVGRVEVLEVSALLHRSLLAGP